ncbi:hypothetical protein [Actinoplanes sp. NPDC026623]|uniref:hypothetical protein n=1 Tax=Actinoplanes sp. NPDC026623 TaxID=3155610 RepID=UPI0033ED0A94
MFSDMLSEEPGASPWATPGRAAITAASLEDDETSAVLEAIDDAAAGFAALSGVSPADMDDFERGVRQLRRIVLTRTN